MDNVLKETHAVSVMTQSPLETVAKAREEQDDRLLLSNQTAFSPRCLGKNFGAPETSIVRWICGPETFVMRNQPPTFLSHVHLASWRMRPKS